jgi:hypothetical protein
VVELVDGDVLELAIAPVAKTIGERTPCSCGPARRWTFCSTSRTLVCEWRTVIAEHHEGGMMFTFQVDDRQ